MTARLTWNVARWEFRLLTRGAGFWLAALAASSAAVNLARHGVQNPPLVAYGLAGWALPLVPLLLLPALGSVRRRDEAAGVHELVHSRPVGGLAYALGKFAAGWAALAAAWLVSLAVGLAVATVVWPASLLHWPEVAWRGALLVVPAYAFITALCLAVDALWGRTGAVLAVGAAVILSSLFYVADLWPALLLPLFVPRESSPVFGYDPYTGGLVASRAWTVALALALLAAAVWLLPRRTPALRVPAARGAVAALLALAMLAGAAAVWVLLPVPRPLDWRAEAREWEMAQVRVAASGGTAGPQYWHRHRVEASPWPVEAWVARGEPAAAAALAGHAAALLPHFPGLQPPAGQPFRVFQGTYLHTPRMEDGALVVMGFDAERAASPGGPRSLLRAMAEAYWGRLARVPIQMPDQPVPMSLGDTWADAPSLYHQWMVLEQTAGSAALEQEFALWRQAADNQSSDRRDTFTELRRSGGVGNRLSGTTGGMALALWNLSATLGREQVLDALVAAAAGMPPVRVEVWRDQSAPGIGGWVFRRTPDEGPYWAAVSAALGTDVTTLPGWPEVAGSPGW